MCTGQKLTPRVCRAAPVDGAGIHEKSGQIGLWLNLQSFRDTAFPSFPKLTAFSSLNKWR